MKLTDIVKPSSLGDFIRLQISCYEEASQHAGTERLQFLARLIHTQNHLPGKPAVELVAIYEIASTTPLTLSFLVTDRGDELLALFEQGLHGKEIAAQLGVAWIELARGLLLSLVHIPKPWGQEIWYTGIEQRGVSRIRSEEGESPLDFVFAAAPGFILGQHTTPILLKILDPLPDEVYGDLYFEMHEEKQEVYVVTHIDVRAWADGKGGIRFGFNQQLRKQFSSDAEFKRAYLDAVLRYRAVRVQIDALLDAYRQQEKIGLNDSVAPGVIQRWLLRIDPSLQAQEKQLRAEMENFIAVKPLQVGDVIKVPCFTPHSLQHGVRTVEFQTPVYERRILSFAQKVLTQSHWDTEAVLDSLRVDAPVDAPLRILADDGKARREEVVQFSDFRVERISLCAGARYNTTGNSYALLLVLNGEVQVASRQLNAGAALLLPHADMFRLEAGRDGAVVLLAEPVSA